MQVVIEDGWGAPVAGRLVAPAGVDPVLLLEDWAEQDGPRSDLGQPVWRVVGDQDRVVLEAQSFGYGCAGLDAWLQERGAQLLEA